MGGISPVHSNEAPAAVGPYSQAVACDGMLYLSGQIGLDPATGRLVADAVTAQTRQVLENLGAVLQAAGADHADLVKVTIYLADMADFPVVNDIYARWLGQHRPARATVAVAALPLGAKVEMDAIARLPKQSAQNPASRHGGAKLAKEKAP